MPETCVRRDLLKIATVMTEIEVSRSFVDLLVKRGDLEAVSIGPRDRRITAESYEAYLERLRTATKATDR